MSKQQIGVVGMAVMGRNLALNIESRGYTVSIFNRSREKTEEVIAENPGKKLVPYYTVKEFVESLETPRRILLMVKAGLLLIPLSHTSIKVTSSLMVVIPSSRTPFVVTVSFLQKALTSSVPVFPAVKKVR